MLSLRAYTLKKGHRRTQQEGGYLHATKKGLNRNQPWWCLYLGLLAPRTMTINFSCLSHPAYCYLLWQPGRLIQEPNANFGISFLIASYFAIIIFVYFCTGLLSDKYRGISPLHCIHRILENRNFITCAAQTAYLHPFKQKHHLLRLSTPQKRW